MNFDGNSFVLTLLVNTFFTTGSDVDGNIIPNNKTVDIQYSNTLYSISCQLADYQHEHVYWIKFSKEINGSYWDIVDVHKTGEENDSKWFPGTDIPSRSSNVGSDLNTAKLVLNLLSNTIKESDNGIYKCEINTMKGVYSDTLNVDWREGNDNSSVRPTESVLLYLTIFLLLKSNWY